MSQSHSTKIKSPVLESDFTGSRPSVKRPRERSVSPHFVHGGTEAMHQELDSEETLLSFSDLIRPLSTTPSPEPSLHFGTPPRTMKLNKTSSSTLSESEPNRLFDQMPGFDEEELDDTIDDSKVAEMRKQVIAWGLGTGGSKASQSSSSWERKLSMMVMALTHPTRPTASQIAAQAEHIRALLAERSVIVQQLEDLGEFRQADRLGFERTAQALNARRGSKLDGTLLTTRETVYQDERTRNAELHAQNERLSIENSRLERDLKDAKREIRDLKQSIENLRVNLLIRPRKPSSANPQSALHPIVISPTPNPRGRPRKHPLLSPSHTPLFQPATHSNPASQLPVSSMSILNPGASFPTSGQRPPEKRMKPMQPDARAELLLAAARRIGRERVIEVLELERQETSGKDIDEIHDGDLPQSLVYPQHPSGGSKQFVQPLATHDNFDQFLFGANPEPGSGRGRGRRSTGRPSRSTQDTDSANTQLHAPRQPQPQPQQVVVAFTGDPQADAQACLASFMAQYPGIQSVPMWGMTKGDESTEAGIAGEMCVAEVARSAVTRATGGVQRTQSTPELTKSTSRNRGLENLLTAARTVFRARSRSTTPTPRRYLPSTSTLSSPYQLHSRPRKSQSPVKGRHTAPARRRHSSPNIQPGDSDTEPEESPKSQRVYSALDVLADQAAAVRTSSPDPPPPGIRATPPVASGRLLDLSAPPMSPPALPTLLVDTNGSPFGSLPNLGPLPSNPPSSPASSGAVDTRPRALSEGVFVGPKLGLPGATPRGVVRTLGDMAPRDQQLASTIASGGLEIIVHQPDAMDMKMRQTKPPLRTPPKSDKARGKQRAWSGSA